jgi:hypothetical protein
MADKDHIARIIASDWQDNPAKEICLRILDYVYQRRFSIDHLSFGSIKKLIGDDFSEKDVFASLYYLMGSGVKVLEARYQFFEDEDRAIELDPIDVREAYHTGILIHPNTGISIDDFEKKVVMYFVPSRKMKEEYA